MKKSGLLPVFLAFAVLLGACGVKDKNSQFSVFPQNMTVLEGGASEIMVLPDDGRWGFHSDNPNVATVNSSRVVTGISVGNANIEVFHPTYGSVYCKVTVIKGGQLTLSITSQPLYIEQETDISWTPKAAAPRFASSDPIVAEVSASGVVSTYFVGETTIDASDDVYGKASLKVTVSPRYNSYREPIMVKSITRAQIKDYETRTLVYEDEGIMQYKGENSFVMDVVYYFENDEYIGANVYIPYSVANEDTLYEFLYERYYIAEDIFYFWSPYGDVDGDVYRSDDETELEVLYFFVPEQAAPVNLGRSATKALDVARIAEIKVLREARKGRVK